MGAMQTAKKEEANRARILRRNLNGVILTPVGTGDLHEPDFVSAWAHSGVQDKLRIGDEKPTFRE